MNCETELDWIFHQLWTKAKGPQAFSFIIPETIVFRQGKPVNWYFNTNQGIILKKNFQNITMKKIWQQKLLAVAFIAPSKLDIPSLGSH